MAVRATYEGNTGFCCVLRRVGAGLSPYTYNDGETHGSAKAERTVVATLRRWGCVEADALTDRGGQLLAAIEFRSQVRQVLDEARRIVWDAYVR